MNPTKADKLTTLSLAIFRLNGQLVEWGNHFSRPHGLTTARWQVLGAIAMAPHPPNVPQIATVMGVSRQGVLKQINLLVDEGLVQPLSNPTHRRSPLYALTPKGQAAYDALIVRWDGHAQKMAAGFNTADLDAAVKVLSMMSRLYDREPLA